MVDAKKTRLFKRVDFAAAIDAPDELMHRFDMYRDLLLKWQKRINLISRGTKDDLWRRHFLDSAQIYPLIPSNARVLLDLGSGAGFPGLVLALLISELGGPAVHLVEADSRKAAFLNEVNRILETNATVHCRRLESLTDMKADVITARALSPLDRLLHQVWRFMGPETVCLFPKGEKASEELTEAGKHWTMRVDKTASVTHDEACILQLSEVKRVE